ncbi:MAG: hypothetical protein Q9219_006957 [cf. Caloplaca sp. 3 TL-2023]
MDVRVRSSLVTIIIQLLAICLGAYGLPSLDARDPASTPESENVPAPGSLAQGSSIVVARIPCPKTDTTVTFSRLSSPVPQTITQSDSLTCIVEALQEIYSSQRTYGISTHLTRPWSYSGSQQPENVNCLVMQNQGGNLVLTWGIVVESLRAVAIGLSNTTFSSVQFDVYNGKWGHLGYGSLGMQQGEGQIQSA